MVEVVGITFKHNSKIYYFSAKNFKIKKGINVIVKTERGLQFGKVELENFYIKEEKINYPLNEIVRIATKSDFNSHLKNEKDAKKAIQKCREIVDKYNLNMAILDANYTFDRSQLLFTFLSDNRVDFRKLAKDLAIIYKTRIELRQVGVRDKAKEVGGYGSCGRPLCCSIYLNDFDSVSINMAKDQNIALNPNKINGVCGRLLCCFKYENECYKEYSKKLPKIGKTIETAEGVGKVINVDILSQKYKVNIKDKGVMEFKVNESD